MLAESAYFTREPDWVAGPARVGSLNFWRGVNPHLKITSNPFAHPARPYAVENPDLQQALEQICAEGYLQTAPAPLSLMADYLDELGAVRACPPADLNPE